MTSHRFPLSSEKLNRYPHVDGISYRVEEKIKVDLIYQYVKDCHVFSKNNSSFNNIYRTKCMIGKPTRFPNYGNSLKTFIMKTYGPEVSLSPWQDELPHIPWNSIQENNKNNYIYIEFHEAVYPIKISIYEVCNPGYIIEIWAQSANNVWFLLWNGSHQIVPLTSRVFSPPLRTCDFKTKKLKLKFKHNIWNNYTVIDAIMLIGSSQLILSKNFELSLTNLLKPIKYKVHHYNNLTADDKNTHLDIDYLQTIVSEYYTIYKRKTVDQNNSKHKVVQKVPDHEQSFKQKYLNYLIKSCSNLAITFPVNKSQNKSQELSHLSALPDEIILKILKNLDLLTLCRMNQVNKRFNNLTEDPLLYTCLNMRYIRKVDVDISNMFCYFTPRCKYLRQLDLTFSNFSEWDIVQFLDNCGKHLTHLRLNRCRTVNNVVLFKISTICKNLKVLDLTFYPCILLNRFYLKDLRNLEYLNLSNTFIDTVNSKFLCETLQKNQRMRKLNLKNSWVLNLNEVLIELRSSCPDLEIIILKDMFNVTSKHIDILIGCKNLRKVNLHVTSLIPSSSLHKLFSSCQRLEEVHLSRVLFNKHNFGLLTCKNKTLIKLCLYIEISMIPGLSDDTMEYSIIFEQCPKLQEFYVNCCISQRVIDEWKKKFPNVSIFESFYCNRMDE